VQYTRTKTRVCIFNNTIQQHAAKCRNMLLDS